MLFQFDRAKGHPLEDTVISANKGQNKQAVDKVAALFTYTYNKTETTHAHRSQILLFTALLDKEIWHIKHQMIKIGYDAEQNRYLVLRVTFSPVTGQESYSMERTLTEDQLLSLAKAYDLGLHLGTHSRFQNKAAHYLLFDEPDYETACNALDASMKESYRKARQPNTMEIYEPLLELVNKCYGQDILKKHGKLKPQ